MVSQPHPNPEPEYHVDNERVRSFIETVKETADEHEEIPALVEALEEPFEALLYDDDWLPDLFTDLCPSHVENKGNMGEGIAQWLIYREGHKLALFTLVLPPGVSTPIHDHLAWGLVGIHGGAQSEEFYRRLDDLNKHEGEADLEHLRTERMERGDYYELIPPNNDIHSVETISDEPSVSVHLLGADVGCIDRHAFDAEEGEVGLFHSGYTNVDCEEYADPPEIGETHDHAGHGHAHD